MRIVVNATALDRSGALGILRQFMANIPDAGYQWLVFVSADVEVQASVASVRIVPVSGVKSAYKRLWWDAFGLNRWLGKHHIEPLALVSLQNTGFRVSKKNVPRYIYYHQPLPFYPYTWNPLKKGNGRCGFTNIFILFVSDFFDKRYGGFRPTGFH